MQETIQKALDEARQILDQGELASYIPELAKANPDHLGLYLITEDGRFESGDTDVEFTMQSIAKVATLLVALELFGFEKVFSKVDMEPSGAPFSELSGFRDLSETPANPFINSGAIALSSLIASEISFEEYLAYMGKICARTGMVIDEQVYESEMAHSERNHSLAWELKRMKLLTTDLEESLCFYTKSCSITVSARDLAEFAFCLANYGKTRSGEQIFSPDHVKVCLSLMFTCGLYDGSGNFSVKAGLPAKSGVGGGIIAIVPNQAGLASFGPSLDHNGNSIGGVKAIELISKDLNFHCFEQSK